MALTRRILAVAAILAATATAVVLVLDPASLPAADELPAAPPVVLPRVEPGLATPGLSPGPTASPGPSAPPPAVVLADPADGSASGSSTGSGGVPAPPPVEVEAESGAPAAVLTGSAAVIADADASGGARVTGIGETGGGEPGTITFTASVPVAGSYRITMYVTNGEAGAQRSAEVSVGGSDPVTVTYGGRARCCGVRALQTVLGAGPVTITIANPNGAAPSVDKIVLTAV